ncbi:MAG: hypothetical protein KGI26_06975 [Thaumarchaeota archaeon]|nr:hypothetical protein [Nitrososphaerota archaeon]
MLRSAIFALLLDTVFVAGLLFVYQDIAWRTAYAASVHSACPSPGCAYTSSFSFGVLTRIFTMSGTNVALASPPTLDWVQVFALALVVVNGWLAYGLYRGWSRRPKQGAVAAVAQ